MIKRNGEIDHVTYYRYVTGSQIISEPAYLYVEPRVKSIIGYIT